LRKAEIQLKTSSRTGPRLITVRTIRSSAENIFPNSCADSLIPPGIKEEKRFTKNGLTAAKKNRLTGLCGHG
jgi:hypothetical protein